MNREEYFVNHMAENNKKGLFLGAMDDLPKIPHFFVTGNTGRMSKNIIITKKRRNEGNSDY